LSSKILRSLDASGLFVATPEGCIITYVVQRQYACIPPASLKNAN
jgi:hypothetical protein